MQSIRLTAELTKKITDLIRVGNYLKVAAGAHGVKERTFWLWWEKGRDVDARLEAAEEDVVPTAAELLYLNFYRAVELAQEEAHWQLVVNIRNAASMDWKAASWMLERKFPQQWAAWRKIEVSGPDGNPFVMETTGKLEVDIDNPAIRQKMMELSELVADQMLGAGQPTTVIEQNDDA